MTRALYPGSFDPLTNGHLDIIERASKLWDEVFVGVFTNTSKKEVFLPNEKVALLEEAIIHLPNVQVIRQERGLTVETGRKYDIDVLIRGLRSVKDFEYERDIALMNRHLAQDIETVFLMSDEKYSFVSSSLIKEIAIFGGDISSYVPRHVQEALTKKFQ